MSTSTLQASSEEDWEDDSSEDIEELPLITLSPRLGYNVNPEFECPAKDSSSTFVFTFATVQGFAKQGCPHCILRVAAISDIFPDRLPTTKINYAHDNIFVRFSVQGECIVLASYEPVPKDENEMELNFHSYRTRGITCLQGIAPCDTGSSESLETVKNWLQQCDENHDCTNHIRSILPKRLLHVQADSIHLHETTPSDLGARYACLSHCWGKPSPVDDGGRNILRTTVANFDSHGKRIPWESLPNTFQDAVSFTRRLGIPFLWIDSLCIIQDEPDRKDWHEQSANMANIYRNAYITLAATSAENAHGGMYTRNVEGTGHRVSATLATIRYQDGQTRQIFARRNFAHKIKSLPLLLRGWVYQERLLSPRMLHFTGEELVWECNRLSTCECGSDDLENTVDRIQIYDDDYLVVGRNHQHPVPMNKWYTIVNEYTALALTKESDVFPALSGIAKAFGDRIGDVYAAGLWKGRMIENMLWYFEEQEGEERSKEEKTRTDQEADSAPNWRAPSWSWAATSVASGIWFLPVTRKLASVKDVLCKPSGADSTGELQSAFLTLTAKVLRANYLAGTIYIKDSFPIRKAPITSLQDSRTGYLDLKDVHNAELVFAQMASFTEKKYVYLYEVYDRVSIDQEVRMHLILTRRGDHWIRVGAATIAAYEPDETLYAGRPREERKAIVNAMSREMIVSKLEQQADRTREMFRCFDEADVRDLIMW
ncbi:hypothetical protein ACEQ8H_008198 [Pleosporales sp. CAS-2024a]